MIHVFADGIGRYGCYSLLAEIVSLSEDIGRNN